MAVTADPNNAVTRALSAEYEGGGFGGRRSVFIVVINSILNEIVFRQINPNTVLNTEYAPTDLREYPF